MSTMPKRIDAELKARAVRLVSDHQGEYSSLTAAAAVVAKQLGVGKESVRRWVIQSQVDGGQRAGATTEELAEIKALKAENRRLREDVEILREQGCHIAARTYRSWKTAGRVVAARTVSDAHVVDAVREIAWTTKVDSDGVLVRKLSPAGLYGRRKMTAHLRRTVWPEASAGSVDRAMRTLGLSGVRRDKGVRTTIPAKDGSRAGDLLDRNFTAAAPNRTWVTDFTYVRTWAGFTYVTFIVDVYAQRIVAWHAATTKHTDLVMIPRGWRCGSATAKASRSRPES